MELSKKDVERVKGLLSSACNLLCDSDSDEYDCDTCPILALQELFMKDRS